MVRIQRTSENKNNENEIIDDEEVTTDVDESGTVSSELNNDVELSEDIFNDYLNKIKTKFENIDIESSLLPVLTKETMEIVEKTKLSGEMKKELAKKLINNIIDNAAINNEEKELCEKIISSGVLDETIDILVEISRGNFIVNDLNNRGVGCFKKLIKAIKCYFSNRSKSRKVKREAEEKAKKEAEEKAKKEAEEKARKKEKLKVKILVTKQSILERKKAKKEAEEKKSDE